MVCHEQLIRLKHYYNNEKLQYKINRAIVRIKTSLKHNKPIIILVYSTGCYHCVSFMKDKVERGKRYKSTWRLFRKDLLSDGFTVFQINVNSSEAFTQAAFNFGNNKLNKIAEYVSHVNGVPSILGMNAKGNMQTYDKSRELSDLHLFANGLKK